MSRWGNDRVKFQMMKFLVEMLLFDHFCGERTMFVVNKRSKCACVLGGGSFSRSRTRRVGGGGGFWEEDKKQGQS